MTKMTVSMLLLAGVCAMHPGRADVFDDARIWYRDFADRNGNSTVDTGEVRDCLHAGNAADARNQSAKSGSGELGFSTEDVLCQYSQKTLSGVSCLDLPQEDGKQAILDTGYKSDATDFTAIIRFKRGSLYDSTQGCVLMGIGWNSPSGLLVGFEKEWNRLWLHYGGAWHTYTSDDSVGGTIQFGQDTWIEMAVVAKGTKLTIYARKNNYQNIRYDITLGSAISLDSNATFKIGAQRSSSNNAFRGKVHQFAYWERALTEAEVFEALSYTGVESIDLWQAGSRVVGACPFGGASGTAVNLGDTSTNWFAGAHWFDIPAVWTAGTSITTQFEVPQYFGGINQSVAVAACSGSGNARVFVDNVEVGACGVRAANWTRCMIPGSMMTVGKHALRIEHAGGEFAPQFISVAGSWQLGESYTDKGTGSSDYYVKTKNLKKLRYSCLSKDDGTKTPVAIHFDLDKVEAGGQYEFSFNCFGSNPKSDAVELYVNGVLKVSYSASNWTGTKKVKIGYGEFQEGENVVTFVNADTSHVGASTYMACDWYRLELIKPFKTGVCLIFR